MAITDPQFEAWLDDDNARQVALLDVSYYDSTVKTAYLSTHPFITRSADTPANTPYDDVISSIPEINARIDSDGLLASLTFINDGSLDSFLDYTFIGHSYDLYLGDISWPKSDFRKIVTGINGALNHDSNGEFTFNLLDKRHRLDKPIITALVNQKLTPFGLGDVFNATPIVTNAALLDYQCNDHTCTITAVRDNGVGVSYTDNGNGTFRLATTPVGTVTCDFNDTNLSAGQMVNYLALRAGLTAPEIDNSYPNTADLQFYLTGEMSYLSAITSIMESVGGHWRFTRLGVLELVRLDLPTTPTNTISPSQVIKNTTRQQSIEQPYQQLKMAYAKNWTVQGRDGIAGSVSEANRDLYSSPHKIIEKLNSIVTEYPMAESPEIVETYFVSQADATTEINRRGTIRSAARRIYGMDLYINPLLLNVGDEVTVTVGDSPVFDAGQDAIIVELDFQTTNKLSSVGVWL